MIIRLSGGMRAGGLRPESNVILCYPAFSRSKGGLHMTGRSSASRALSMTRCSGAAYRDKPSVHTRSTTFDILPSLYLTGAWDRSRVEYPSDERILALAEQHLPASWQLQILDRPTLTPAIVVRLPKGTKAKERAAFVAAIQKETKFRPVVGRINGVDFYTHSDMRRAFNQI